MNEEQTGVSTLDIKLSMTPEFERGVQSMRPLVDEIMQRLGERGVSEEYSADGLTLLIAALVEEHRLRAAIFGSH